MSEITPVDVMEEVVTTLQSIAALTNKVVVAYDNSNLVDLLKGVSFPGAGVVYEGMMAMPEAGATSKIGISCEVRFSIIMVQRMENIVRTNTKYPMLLLLQSVRDILLGMKGVTGHRYRFVVEAPAEVKSGTTFWIQRWAIPIQLPSSRIVG